MNVYVSILFVVINYNSVTAQRQATIEFRGPTKDVARGLCVQAAKQISETFDHTRAACLNGNFYDE